MASFEAEDGLKYGDLWCHERSPQYHSDEERICKHYRGWYRSRADWSKFIMGAQTKRRKILLGINAFFNYSQCLQNCLRWTMFCTMVLTLFINDGDGRKNRNRTWQQVPSFTKFHCQFDHQPTPLLGLLTQLSEVLDKEIMFVALLLDSWQEDIGSRGRNLSNELLDVQLIQDQYDQNRLSDLMRKETKTSTRAGLNEAP